MNRLSPLIVRRVGPLASRPVTLGLLMKIYKNRGELPHTQAELYRTGCRLLATETAGVSSLGKRQNFQRTGCRSRRSS